MAYTTACTTVQAVIIERVVKTWLTDHLFAHNAESTPVCIPTAPFHRSISLIHPRPSHHCYWFTKTILSLSAAFDTIDHDILLTRLSSWFGIHGSVLNWFKSYLSSRTFCGKCNDCFSSLHTSLYGVPRGCVLGLLLFIMYTTPLSTLISSLSLYHHLEPWSLQ